MAKVARGSVLLSLGILFLAVLLAQSESQTVPLIRGFQLTGNDSAWAWGKNTFAQDIETRKFHLWHIINGNITASTLPSELATPVEDLYPGVSFLDDHRGFVVWTQDRVSEPNNEARFTIATAQTLDAGHSWHIERQSVTTAFTFTGVNQVQFADPQNGHLIVGVDAAMGSTFKTLLHTTDGGKRWEVDAVSQAVVGSENAPIHMFFHSNSEGWILTAGVHGQPYPNILLSHSTDGGHTWHSFNKFAQPSVCRPNCAVQNISPVYFDGEHFNEAFFLVSYWYAPTGSVPVYYLSSRYRSHDGGATWCAAEKFDPPGRDWIFADFDFGLTQNESRFFLTNNGGTTWSYSPALSRILAPYKASMLSKGFHRRGHSLWLVVEVGEKSLILRSLDDGTSWQRG